MLTVSCPRCGELVEFWHGGSQVDELQCKTERVGFYDGSWCQCGCGHVVVLRVPEFVEIRVE